MKLGVPAAGAIGALLIMTGSAHAATNLLTNGDFETGSFSGWTITEINDPECLCRHEVLTESQPINLPDGDVVLPHSGRFFASAANDQEIPGNHSSLILSQSIDDVLGQRYRVSGWVNGSGADQAAGASMFFSSGGVSKTYILPTALQPWDHLQFDVTGTGLDTFELHIVSQGFPSNVFLDNFSITPVPEPAAWALMIAGFGMVGWAARRRSYGSGLLALAA